MVLNKKSCNCLEHNQKDTCIATEEGKQVEDTLDCSGIYHIVFIHPNVDFEHLILLVRGFVSHEFSVSLESDNRFISLDILRVEEGNARKCKNVIVLIYKLLS